MSLRRNELGSTVDIKHPVLALVIGRWTWDMMNKQAPYVLNFRYWLLSSDNGSEKNSYASGQCVIVSTEYYDDKRNIGYPWARCFQDEGWWFYLKWILHHLESTTKLILEVTWLVKMNEQLKECAHLFVLQYPSHGPHCHAQLFSWHQRRGAVIESPTRDREQSLNLCSTNHHNRALCTVMKCTVYNYWYKRIWSVISVCNET